MLVWSGRGWCICGSPPMDKRSEPSPYAGARPGFERAAALVAQQNTLQRFADDGYEMVRWYAEGEGVDLDGAALSQSMDDGGL